MIIELELFDSHAHYNDEKFEEERDKVLQEIYNSGVTKLVNAGYSLQSSKAALEIAKKYNWIYTISGISPNDVPDDYNELEKEINELEEFINKEKNSRKIVGIGEIGLDLSLIHI